MRFRSKDFVVDTTTRQVTRGRKVVPLSPKAFELLTTLLAERPAAVSKADLQRRLWPDTFVSEANIAVLVAEIRSALGDSARAPRTCGPSTASATRSAGRGGRRKQRPLRAVSRPPRA